MEHAATGQAAQAADAEPPMYAAPAMVDLALEFLRGNSAGVALNSLLGKTTALVKAVRARARLVKRLQQLTSADGAEGDMVGLCSAEQRSKLAGALTEAGLRTAAAGVPPQLPRADLAAWIDALQRLQLQEMAEFEQIKRKVDRDAGALRRFIDIAETLLRQLPGLAQQENRTDG